MAEARRRLFLALWPDEAVAGALENLGTSTPGASEVASTVAEAEKLKAQLEKAGAKVELK